MEDLFVKIHAALNPEGYFVSFQDGMTKEHLKPDFMLRAGFESVSSRTVETP